MEGIWRQKHPGGTQEAPRRPPGGTQDAPRRSPVCTQDGPKATQRHPEAPKTQPETPRRQPGTREVSEAKYVKTRMFFNTSDPTVDFCVDGSDLTLTQSTAWRQKLAVVSAKSCARHTLVPKIQLQNSYSKSRSEN